MLFMYAHIVVNTRCEPLIWRSGSLLFEDEQIPFG